MLMKKDCSSLPSLGIISYSDFYDIPEKKVWGDYWFKKNLIATFEELGYPVDNSSPKIRLHLFGEPVHQTFSDTYNILWLHSHPDWITPEILGKYQKIYCISSHFIKKITTMGFQAEYLMIPTHMKPLIREKSRDIVFIGNTKKNTLRPVIRDLGRPPYRVTVWGWGWDGLIPANWYGGMYYENNRLNELYACSKIVLNDHHEDMRREGFINPRILDVLASGGFVISDSVLGMDELLDHSVVTYETPEDLQRAIHYYMQEDQEREMLATRGREIAVQFTYTGICKKIIRHIESIFDRVSS